MSLEDQVQLGLLAGDLGGFREFDEQQGSPGRSV